MCKITFLYIGRYFFAQDIKIIYKTIGFKINLAINAKYGKLIANYYIKLAKLWMLFFLKVKRQKLYLSRMNQNSQKILFFFLYSTNTLITDIFCIGSRRNTFVLFTKCTSSLYLMSFTCMVMYNDVWRLRDK